MLGVRVVATVSLRLIPLVGAKPGHAKRVVLAELLRERTRQAGGTIAPLVRTRKRWADDTATTFYSPVKRRPAPDASHRGDEALRRCGT